jgi:all-trans-retinol 13,14-reductase
MEGTVKFPRHAVKEICRTIVNAGGTVLVNARVTEFMVSQGHIGGIKLYDGIFFADRVISAVGVINTLKLVNLPQLNSCYKSLSVSHFSVFIGLRGSQRCLDLPQGNVWIRRPNENDVFMSFEEQQVGGLTHTAVHILSPETSPAKWFTYNASEYEREKTKRLDELSTLFYTRFPGTLRSEIVKIAGTPKTTNEFINSPMGCSYGISAGSRRFLDWKTVRALRPGTSIRGLYLTGQDILMVGICSAMASGLMTARQILGYSLCDAIRGKDIIDDIKSFNEEHSLNVRTKDANV